MIGSIVFLVVGRLAMAFNPSVEERCLMLDVILNSKAKIALQGGARPGAIDMPFPKLSGVEKRVRYNGRTVVRAEWQEGRRYREVLVGEDVCHQAAFMLEKQQNAADLNLPDLVVLITLAAHPAPGTERFTFEESLSLNRAARRDPSVGGVALPRIRYRGNIERAAGGGWTSIVTSARLVP